MAESTFKITAAKLPSHGTGPLSFQFYTVNGTSPYTYAIITGSLPGDSTLSAAGLLEWTDPTPGTYSFTVRVTDNGAQVAQVAVTLRVYGASFGTISLYQLPPEMIQAVDKVLSLLATDNEFRRHFAKLPSFPTEDFAHYASDIAVDPAGGTSYQALSTAFAALAQHAIAVLSETSIASFISVSGSPDRAVFEFGDGDLKFWVGSSGVVTTMAKNFRFLAGSTGDAEYVTADGHKLKIVVMATDNGDDIEPGSMIDPDGFTTGLDSAGDPITAYRFSVEVDTAIPAEQAITGNVDGDLPIRMVIGERSTALSLPPNVLIEVSRFFTSAQALNAQAAAGSPVLSLSAITPNVGTGDILLSGANGIGITGGSSAIDIELNAEINGVPFSGAGALTLVPGNNITITPDVGGNSIRIGANVGVSTLNSKGPTGGNFVLLSSDNSISIEVDAGEADLRLNVQVATETTDGLMTTGQVLELNELIGEAITRLHYHDGADVLMGGTVSSSKGLFPFSADTPVSEMISLINDYLATQNPAPTVADLTGKALTISAGLALGSGIIPSDDDASPIGISYGTGYEPGDTTARLNTDVSVTDAELVTTAFADAESGDVIVELNGAEIDRVTLVDADGTYNGPNGHISVLSSIIPGTISSRQGVPTVIIPKADMRLGYNFVTLTHEVTPVTDVRDAITYAFYYDDGVIAASLTSWAFDSTSSPVYVSGIPFMPAADNLLVSATVNNLARESLAANPLKLTIDGNPEDEIAYNDAAASGLGSPPQAEATWILTDYDSGLVVGDLTYAATAIGFVLVDPVTGDAASVDVINGTDMNLLFLPSGLTTATDQLEDFADEEYRLDADAWAGYTEIPTATTPTGNVKAYGWDSGSQLRTQNLWGEADVAQAQIFRGILREPAGNLSTRPSYPATTVNYTTVGAAGAHHYDRWFPTTKAHKRIIIRIYGVDSEQLGRGYYNRAGSPEVDLNVEFKVPGAAGTVWLDAVAGSSGEYVANGAGALFKSAVDGSDGFGPYVDLNVVVGGTTVNRGGGVVVRLTLRSEEVEPTRVALFSAVGGTY